MEVVNKSSLIKVTKIWKSKEVSEGDGVKLRRIIGIKAVPDIDPFLMLDHIDNALLPNGFPDHPHRGFETVTYVTKGKLLHEDFKGHKGEIGEGEIQWMTAGKGIVHAEMPYSESDPSGGFQLWINLAKENKMKEPNYQEFKKDKIPVFIDNNTKSQIKIIAGNYQNLTGPCKSSTQSSYFDVKMRPNTEFLFEISEDKNGFLYLFEGDSLIISDYDVIEPLHAASFKTANEASGFIKFNTKNTPCRFLLVFGKPIREPVYKYGPFVMNTEEDIEETFSDYRNSRNGFENAKKWRSKIKDLGEI